jgi:general secretion pathway protein G
VFKNAFSLIELIFVIAIIAVISSIAIPKLMNVNTSASVSSIKQDVNSIISSVQSYYLINGNISKISDAINLNKSVWNISDTIVKYKEGTKTCITITLSTKNIILNIDSTSGNICKKLIDEGIENITYNFN